MHTSCNCQQRKPQIMYEVQKGLFLWTFSKVVGNCAKVSMWLHLECRYLWPALTVLPWWALSAALHLCKTQTNAMLKQHMSKWNSMCHPGWLSSTQCTTTLLNSALYGRLFHNNNIYSLDFKRVNYSNVLFQVYNKEE